MWVIVLAEAVLVMPTSTAGMMSMAMLFTPFGSYQVAGGLILAVLMTCVAVPAAIVPAAVIVA